MERAVARGYGGTMLEGPIGNYRGSPFVLHISCYAMGYRTIRSLVAQREDPGRAVKLFGFSLTLPSGTGLGVTPDEDRLRFFQRDCARNSFQYPRA
jgi:muconate cycloisomerase